MLQTLNIENIAVIERAEIEFGRGFNVLTGETGAGKSIVIDSLEAALGWRTSKELVRTGAASGRVSAVFTPDGVEDWLREHELEGEDGELMLTRRITADGKSSSRINGIPVPAATLRELGLMLIDIHGQGDGARLTDERFHLRYLDSFGRTEREQEAYAAAYDKYSAALKRLEELRMDESEKARRMDMLTYQIAELNRAQLTPGEYDEKSARRAFLKNAGKLSQSVEEADAALSGGDRADGALNLIENALESVTHAARYSDSFVPIVEKLRDLKFACQDAAMELRDMADELDFDPSELDELDERLDSLKRVLRKYGGTEEAALEYLEKSERELKTIEYADEEREELEKKLEKYRAAAEKEAAVLTKARAKAAAELSRRIEAELQALSMGGARFTVSITDAGELTKHGKDDVRFLMSANAGEGMGRISRVASGGELSRVMLAMKSVLSENDPTDAMVFDEIDTGVSGIAAQRVAEKLAGIAKSKQVICVTHLPQLASMADIHFNIRKAVESGRTYTAVEKLTEDGRARELARLIGGENVTELTLQAAREQLSAAKSFKE